MIEILEQRARRGERVVALDERPVLVAHLAPVMEAFWDLCGDRGGEGVGPIRYTAIDACARRLGIEDPDDFRHFHKLIKALDGVYVRDAARRREEAIRGA